MWTRRPCWRRLSVLPSSLYTVVVCVTSPRAESFSFAQPKNSGCSDVYCFTAISVCCIRLLMAGERPGRMMHVLHFWASSRCTSELLVYMFRAHKRYVSARLEHLAVSTTVHSHPPDLAFVQCLYTSLPANCPPGSGLTLHLAVCLPTLHVCHHSMWLYTQRLTRARPGGGAHMCPPSVFRR